MNCRNSCVAVSFAFLAMGVVAHAANPNIDDNTVRRLSRVGPFTTALGEKATLRVPTGYRMVTADKLTEFSDLFDISLAGDELGMLFPADNADWSIMAIKLAKDPLKGIDPATIGTGATRDALLDWQKTFAEERRVKRSGLLWTVAGWTHPPSYDAEKKRLTMGVRMTTNADSVRDAVSYQIYQYDAEGNILLLNQRVGLDKWERAIPEAQKLMNEITLAAKPVSEAAPDATMYYAQVIGGGVAGAVLVVVLFSIFVGKKKPAKAVRKVRRPGVVQ